MKCKLCWTAFGYLLQARHSRRTCGLAFVLLWVGACVASGAQEPVALLHEAQVSPQCCRPELRGLIAGGELDGQPTKSVYFFPGESADYNRPLYTAHPALAEDKHWNSDPSTRAKVIDRIEATHANTLVMSYWGDEMTRWSPMAIDDTSLRGVIDAVRGRPMVIAPVLESGYDPHDADRPHWRFAEEFPYADGVYSVAQLAPGLIARIHALYTLFEHDLDHWAKLYDRRGRPRYVVHIIGAYALQIPDVPGRSSAATVADAFDAVAAVIRERDGIDIGFTLDVGAAHGGAETFTAREYGPAFEACDAVLAIQGFLTEIYTGRVISSLPFTPPFDNNKNLDHLLRDKLALIDGWVETGVPVIYDVSPGFDGRFVWLVYGTGYWGDNFSYTSDDWRNRQSEQKGRGTYGVTFNTWNGFTEGYAAVPTVEHDSVIYDWLTDLFEPDPRECSHVEYRGGQSTHRLAGPVCETWREHGGGHGFLGRPTSDEVRSARGSVVSFQGGSIFASRATGAHEVHGAIHAEYARLGFDASCLGLPISDEEPIKGGRISHFQHGEIRFVWGQWRATSRCEITLSSR
ncbi:MAG: hypothetical protein ABW321_31520 [Polyangiales bacterium]